MKSGKAIVSWSEPGTWHEAVRVLAKAERISTYPWLSSVSVLSLVAGLGVWKWLDADPATRASLPILVAIVATQYGFILGMGWVYVRLNRTSRTTIYERGIVHGSLTRKRWIPWSEIDYFYVDEDSMGIWTFRFLTWLRKEEADEEFSVVPDEVDLDAVVRCFKDNKVEHAIGQGHE